MLGVPDEREGRQGLAGKNGRWLLLLYQTRTSRFFFVLPALLLLLLLLSRLEPLAPVAGEDHLMALNDLIPKRTVCGLEQRRAPQARASARLFVVGAPLVADAAPLASPPLPSSHRPLCFLAVFACAVLL